MRVRLLHPLAERRHGRRSGTRPRRRGRPAPGPGSEPHARGGGPQQEAPPTALPASSAPPAPDAAAVAATDGAAAGNDAARAAGAPGDIAAMRVREAGGPLDRASYVCLCGFAFAAAVSTSVRCPHCGAEQAW